MGVKEKVKNIIISALVFAVAGSIVYTLKLAFISGRHNNFEECVAENIKNTSSEDGARAIHMACRGLFPEKKYESYEQCFNELSQRKEGGISPGVSPKPNLSQYTDEELEALLKAKKAEIESDCREYFPTAKTKKYYKCILENMKGVSTDIAARAIFYQCQEKYLKSEGIARDTEQATPQTIPQKRYRPLTPEEKAELLRLYPEEYEKREDYLPRKKYRPLTPEEIKEYFPEEADKQN